MEKSDPLFFPERNSRSKIAEDFCCDCPVRMECLDYAIVHNEIGIWGGTTAKERESFRNVMGEFLTKKAIREGWFEDREGSKSEFRAEFEAVVHHESANSRSSVRLHLVYEERDL